MRSEGVGARCRIWIFEAATLKIPAETMATRTSNKKLMIYLSS